MSKSEIIHEGKKYEAKEINGEMCFVPIKEETEQEKLWKEFENGTIYKASTKFFFREPYQTWNMRLVFDVYNGKYGFIITDTATAWQTRSTISWSDTIQILISKAKESRFTIHKG